MADTKISALTASTTPLAGTEVLPIVQSSTTKKVAVSDLTVGREVTAQTFVLNALSPATPPTANVIAATIDRSIGLSTFALATTYGGTPSITLRSSGGTNAAPTATTASSINIVGGTTSDGTTFFNTSAITAGVDGSVTAGSHPTYFAVSTTPSGSTARVERFRVNAVGDALAQTGNFVVSTSGKGITNSTGSVALNFSTAGTSLNSAQSVLSGSFPNVGTAQTITITDTNGGYVVITGVQGGVGSSTWTLPFAKRGGSIAIGTPSKAILTADPILSVAASSGNIVVTPLAGNTYFTFAIYYTPLGA